MNKKALFVISTKELMVHKAKLAGLDYEAKLSADGKNAYVVVRDCNHYVGDPIAYVAKIFDQHATRAYC